MRTKRVSCELNFGLPERATSGHSDFIRKMGAKILTRTLEPLNAKNPREIKT